MKLIKFLTVIIIFNLFATGCTSLKETLSGQKKQNSDEFLVKKKNPLELPPDFDQLPTPKKDEENIDQSAEIDEEIENLFKNSDEIDSSDNTTDSNQSAEEFVLKKINKN